MSKENNSQKSIPERIGSFVKEKNYKFARDKNGSASGGVMVGVLALSGILGGMGVYEAAAIVGVLGVGFAPINDHTLYYKGFEVAKEGCRKVKDKVLKRKDMSGAFNNAIRNSIQNGLSKIKENAKENPISRYALNVKQAKIDEAAKAGKEILLYKEPIWKKALRNIRNIRGGR